MSAIPRVCLRVSILVLFLLHGFPFLRGVELLEVGRWALPQSGQANKVHVVGDRIYLAAGSAGLLILDGSNTDLSLIGHYDTPGLAFAVAIKDNFAYIADGPRELQIVNIADPARPVLVGSFYAPKSGLPPGAADYDPDAYGFDVITHGNALYFADGKAGLLVFDISIPGNPMFSASYKSDGVARSIEAQGDFAILRDDHTTARLFNVSNQLAPGFIGRIGTPVLEIVNGVAIAGNYAYVTFHDGSLRVIELSTQNTISSYPIAADARDVDIVGNVALVANGNDGLLILDVTDPSNLKRLGQYSGSKQALQIAGIADKAYVVSQSSGLEILDLSDPNKPLFWARMDPNTAALDIQVVDNYAYLASAGGGLNILDVTTPSQPQLIGKVSTRATAFDLAVDGDLAMVADHNAGAQIIDVSDPRKPAIVGNFTPTRNTWGVDIVGNTGYVAARDLYILDLANPSAPVLLGTYTMQSPPNAYRVTVRGNLAFLGKFNEGPTEIVNVADPANPLPLGKFLHEDLYPANYSIAFQGNNAFLATGAKSAFTIFDFSDPASPRQVGSFGSPILGSYFAGIALDANRVYLGDNMEFLVLDASTPAHPALLASLPIVASGVAVAFKGNTVFLAEQEQGLRIFEYRDTGSPVLHCYFEGPSRIVRLWGEPGQNYSVEFAIDPSPGTHWQTLETFSLQTNPYSITDTQAAGHTRYYRARKN